LYFGYLNHTPSRGGGTNKEGWVVRLGGEALGVMDLHLHLLLLGGYIFLKGGVLSCLAAKILRLRIFDRASTFSARHGRSGVNSDRTSFFCNARKVGCELRPCLYFFSKTREVGCELRQHLLFLATTTRGRLCAYADEHCAPRKALAAGCTAARYSHQEPWISRGSCRPHPSACAKMACQKSH